MNKRNPPTLLAPSKQGLFRYSVVAQVIARVRGGEPCAQAVRAVAEQTHENLDGQAQAVSVRSLYRWLAAYHKQGYEGLLAKPRPTLAGSKVLDTQLVSFFAAQKEQDPCVSLPELIRRAREEQLLAPKAVVDRSTVWRTLRRQGVATQHRHQPKAGDCRRFHYPHRLDMVLCDGKHFRVGAHGKRRVALIFLDDASRYGLTAVVGTAESTELFLRGLYRCVLAYGRMNLLYFDHGPGFIAEDSLEVLRKLLVTFIHGRVRYPQGHGKIERFNRTAWNQLLRMFVRDEVDPDCAALTLRVEHFLAEQYNHQPHEGLDGETPHARFHRDAKPLAFFEHHEDLQQAFVLPVERKVSADHVISFEGAPYEAPLGSAGRKLLVYRNLLDGTLQCLHQGRLVRLSPVDPVANARDRRAKAPDPPSVPVPPKSSAERAFERDFGPVLDADGGFSPPPGDPCDES
jgi:transposase InsO family protein